MKNNRKKILVFGALGIDAVVTVFLFVVSIIMIVKSLTMTQGEILTSKGFIAYLQQHPNFYFWLFVFPLFILLALNIVVLVRYVKVSQKKTEVKVDDLSEEQKEALKRQLLEELSKK